MHIYICIYIHIYVYYYYAWICHECSSMNLPLTKVHGGHLTKLPINSATFAKSLQDELGKRDLVAAPCRLRDVTAGIQTKAGKGKGRKLGKGRRKMWWKSGVGGIGSLMILMMLIATIWRQCPRAGLSHAKTALWLAIPAPANTFSRGTSASESYVAFMVIFKVISLADVSLIFGWCFSNCVRVLKLTENSNNNHHDDDDGSHNSDNNTMW